MPLSFVRYSSCCAQTTLKTTMPPSVFSTQLSFCDGKRRRGCIYVLWLTVASRALMPPGWHKEWHIGVRVASNKKLVAFISGVPITLNVREK
jgi:hypothetical protein